MEDIEDLVLHSDRTVRSTENPNLPAIRKNFKNKAAKTKIYDPEALAEVPRGESTVPGSQKVCVVTFGCAHNVSDSEFMMGQLVEYGYELVDSAMTADAVVLNSCTVKNPSEQAVIRMIEEYKQLNKPIIVSGCVPQGERGLKGLENVSLLGVTQIDRVVEVVEEALKGNQVILLEKKELPQLDLPKIRRNKYIEILPINTGCLGNCTYCKTKHARGHLGSYTPSELLRRITRATDEGVCEIWITSEDTGAYGLDINTNIAELLTNVVNELRPNIMLRVGMTNPPYILKHLETIANVLRHHQVYGYLHIPVQSGSNTVLERMNREYTREDFTYIVDYLRANVPMLSFATDIICGFPGETEEEHQETVALLSKYRFEFVNISQFYPRPGTIAARMKQLEGKVKKARSKQISEIFNEYRSTEKHKGKVQRVWFSERENNKHIGDICVGHLKDYTKVTAPFSPKLFGKSFMMHVTICKKWHVEGEIFFDSQKDETISDTYIVKKKREIKIGLLLCSFFLKIYNSLSSMVLMFPLVLLVLAVILKLLII